MFIISKLSKSLTWKNRERSKSERTIRKRLGAYPDEIGMATLKIKDYIKQKEISIK